MSPSSRLWLLPLILTGAVAGCSRPAPPAAAPSRISGSLLITLTSPPPHTGDNTFVVTLTDVATQAPIGNANITATPQMLSPPLPGTSTTGRAQGNGVYTVPVRLGIATRYNIALKIERPGSTAAQVTFPVEAAQ